MTTVGEFNVVPDRIRGHAQRVLTALEGLGQAKQAADYLAQADDGYGMLVRPYAHSTLGELHDDITADLVELTDLTDGLPGKLQTVAEAFEDSDTGWASEIASKAAGLGGIN